MHHIIRSDRFPLLLVILLSTTLLLFFGVADGFASYRVRMPNGLRMVSFGCDHFGHLFCRDGGRINQFAEDFKAAGLTWTKELCVADSDGDGVRNGEEMGDPCCVWTVGATPTRTTDLSLPGDAGSTTSFQITNCDSIIEGNSSTGQAGEEGRPVGAPFYIDIPTYVTIHSILMSIAFMTMYPVAVLIVRHLRLPTTPWFHGHTGFAMFGFALSLAGYIFVEIERGGFLVTSNAHAYIGFVVLVLVFLQLCLGLLRPEKDHPRRSWWYRGHAVLALTILVLSVVELFLGNHNLDAIWKVESTDTLQAILIAYTCMMVILSLGLEVYLFVQRKQDRKSSLQEKPTDCAGVASPAVRAHNTGPSDQNELTPSTDHDMLVPPYPLPMLPSPSGSSPSASASAPASESSYPLPSLYRSTNCPSSPRRPSLSRYMRVFFGAFGICVALGCTIALSIYLSDIRGDPLL